MFEIRDGVAVNVTPEVVTPFTKAQLEVRKAEIISSKLQKLAIVDELQQQEDEITALIDQLDIPTES